MLGRPGGYMLVTIIIITGALGVNAVLGREGDNLIFTPRLFALAGRLGPLLFRGEGLRDPLRVGGGLGGLGVLCTLAFVAAAPSSSASP